MGSKSKYKKDRHKKKDKTRKEKRHKRHRHASVSDLSSSEEEAEGLEEQLARSQAAVSATRDVMADYPGCRQVLRQVLWRLDNDEEVELEEELGSFGKGLPGQVAAVLRKLGMADRGKGRFRKRRRAGSGGETVLGLLGMVLDEPPQPGGPRAKRARTEEVPAAGQEVAEPCGMAAAVAGEEEAAVQAGPEERPQVSEEAPDLEGPDARRMGPAMPARSLLDAAKSAGEAMRERGGLFLDEPGRGGAEEDDDDDVIGPVPPAELLAEVADAADSERLRAVERVMEVVATAERSGQAMPDAYELLGVEPEASARDVRRAFWRLSLLVHPDKCDHERAHDAFQALNAASKTLQDQGSRRKLDERREEDALREYAKEVAEQMERDREWRIARGTATREDLQGPARVGPAALTREEWMTALPDEPDRYGFMMTNQKSVTQFSQKGVTPAGDRSGWTDTPQDKASRLLEKVKQQALALGFYDNDKKKAELEQAVAAAKAPPQKSLVEKHLEEQKKKQKKERKEAKARAKAGSRLQAGDPNDAEAPLPWRTFDREKDLQLPSRKDPNELLRSAGGLANRFGSSGQQQSFM